MEERSDRRRAKRLLCAGLVQVRWTDDAGQPRKVYANLDDLSDGGACLMFDELIAPGIELTLGTKEPGVMADVRYARPTEMGWQIGIQFRPGQRTASLASDVTHLLDPETVPEDPARRQSSRVPRELRDSIACLTLDAAMREAEPPADPDQETT